MATVETDDQPALHRFVRGLRKDLAAVTAGLSMPYSNGPAEGVNNKIKLLSGRCMAAPASPYFVSGSCSADHHLF